MNTQGARRVGAVALAAVAVLAVTSGASAQVDAAPVGRYGTVDMAQVGAGVDASYLLTVRGLSVGTKYAQVADADMIAMGHTFCDAIPKDPSGDIFATWASAAEIPKRVVRSQLAASEAFYCPEHIGFNF